MKTFPTRPANVPEPPKGYVFLGHRRDIKVPPTWNMVNTPLEDRTDFAACCYGPRETWHEWTGMRAHKYYDGYLAAKPDTPLYNLNIKENPMPTHPQQDAQVQDRDPPKRPRRREDHRTEPPKV